MRSRSSVATSILVLVLACFSIGGATMAWFTTSASTGENIFTAGTVNISNPVLVSGGGSWQAGQCNTVTWSFTNNGTKRSYVRVRPDLEVKFYAGTTELSAWVEGYEIDPGSWFGRYFIYKKGESTQENPLRVRLLEGATSNYVGYINVWNNNTHLFISYHMDADYLMDEIQIYAGLTAPTHSKLGLYPFKHTFDTGLAEYFWFETDHVYNRLDTPRNEIYIVDLADGTDIYIAAHVRIFQVSSYMNYHIGAACSPYWVEGSDGWWYYGTPAGPTPLAPGETVNVCFEFCVDSGFNGEITFSLEAEAVQSSHYAIDYIWPSHPWYPLNPG